MKASRIFVIMVTLLLFGGVASGAYYFVNHQDKNSLTLVEKEWIEQNKNQIQDFSIVDDIPVFSNVGKGVIFDFLKDLEENTKLDFNELSYSYGNEPEDTSYAFRIVPKKSKDDILVYRDNYVILTKERIVYNATSDIKSLNLGVLEKQSEKVQKYLTGSTEVVYKTFASAEELLQFNGVDAIVLPKTVYMNQVTSNENLNIAYNITEMTEDYVISLGENPQLNSILKKYYKKWSKEHFDESFREHFTNDYFTFSKIDEKDKATFHSKRYAYGFVDNLPFDTILDGNFVGINPSFLKDFAHLTDVEISFDEYDTVDDLVKAFNSGKVDFFFANNGTAKYDVKTYRTASHINEQIVVLSSKKNSITVNTLASLTGKEVHVVEGTLISEVLKEQGIKVKTSDNVKALIKELSKDDIVVMDLETYNYYQNKLKKFKVDYQFSLGQPYSFISKDGSGNQTFNRFLDFYLTYVNQTEILNQAYTELDHTLEKPSLGRMIILVGSSIIVLFFSIFGIYQLTKREKKQKTIVVKGDKIKYIDMLTSLKNRNYLNDQMEEWDNSEIYPQTIVIVDLNNLNYINDNYGHHAGDSVIKQAASILIKTQMDNSEIIRTSGDEFLIYMVGYTEKQIVSYIRKLHKEFKELEHGFGVASGYSMIVNGIKTIDDAINEATSDMKSNKQEIKSAD